MARDRGAILTIRACRDGVIDFSKARLRDTKWWRRVNILIDSMARDEDLTIVQACYRFHLALVANSQLTEESFKKSKDSALEMFNEIIGFVQPWGAKSTEQRRTDELANLRELYKQEIGDLDDPEFIKNVINPEAQRMIAQEATPDEEQEDRIDRLAYERIMRQARRR